MGSIIKGSRLTGIRRRWLFNCMSIVVLLVLLAVGAFSAVFANYYYSAVRSGLEAKAKTASDFFSSYINQSYNEYYMSAYRFIENFDEKNTLELQFINTRGRIIVSSYGLTAGTTPNTGDIIQAMDNQRISYFMGDDPTTGEHIMAVSSPMIYSSGDVIGVMRYVTSLKSVDRQIVLGVIVALATGIVVILFVVFSNLYFIRSIVGPVGEITETAKRIAAGSYGVQIEKQFDDEIGELADTINDMSNQIDRSEKMQTEFVTSVSHELRTPLTAIAGWGETLLYDDGSDVAQTKRGIATMLKETKRLTNLVEELLEFSRMQDGRFKLSIDDCDIRAEFEDTVFMYGSRLKQENIDLEYMDNDQDIPTIPADGERMKQVFLNLLDNASKHGKEGKRITTEITMEDEGFVTIRIRDFGPGIPEAELPLVKKKFYKGSSKERGNGIGLAVCDEIVTMHNGRLDIENAPGGGALVTIKLPTYGQD